MIFSSITSDVIGSYKLFSLGTNLEENFQISKYRLNINTLKTSYPELRFKGKCHSERSPECMMNIIRSSDEYNPIIVQL